MVWHHSATGPGSSTTGLIALIIHGRADLPGPLAQLVLERDGTFYVVASGKANHAGKGEWLGLDSNYEVMGIEPANNGTGEAWPQIQVDAYQRGTKAIIDKLGVPVGSVCGHKEWAPTRKIDPYGLNMNWQRQQIRELGETVIIRPDAPPYPTRNYVKPYQQALNGWASRQAAAGTPIPGWVPITVDGQYGPTTAAAVTTYQQAAGIMGLVGVDPGSLDDLTRDLLERYVEA